MSTHSLSRLCGLQKVSEENNDSARSLPIGRLLFSCSVVIKTNEMGYYTMEDISLQLQQKYRSTVFEDYIGNEKAVTSYRASMKSGKSRNQIILLEGTTGCGKTTLCRLIFKDYNCENYDDEKGACNECESCRRFDEYIRSGNPEELTDVYELDLTDKSGKRDFDPIFEDMKLPSYGGEWKCYMFDECHKANDNLQNRLLKITEEPPENVLMVFCTTDKEAITPALMNRLRLQLQIRRPKIDQLTKFLAKVCNREKFPYDKKGLQFIASRSDLIIRESLRNLQQVMNEVDSAEYSNMVKVFEVVSDGVMFKFFKLLKSKDVHGYVVLLNEIKLTTDLKGFVFELQSLIKRGIYTINGIEVPGVAESDIAYYMTLFGDMGIDEVAQLLNKVLSLDKDNLEFELLRLGYTGLRTSAVPGDTKEDVVSIDNELSMESSGLDRLLKQIEEDDFKQGLEEVKGLTEAATIDDLFALGITVVNDKG